MNPPQAALSNLSVPSRAAASKARAAMTRQLSSSPEPDLEDAPMRRKPLSRKRKINPKADTASSGLSSTEKEPDTSQGSSKLKRAPSSRALASKPSALSVSRFSPSPPPESFEDKARLEAIVGPLVWVRIDKTGRVVEHEDTVDKDEEWFWWPGGVTKGSLSKGPLHVTFFGAVSSKATTDVVINTLSASTVQPMKTSRGSLAFNATNYRSDQSLSDLYASPSKRTKTSVDERFRFAVEQMVEFDAQDNEGLPSSLSAYTGGIERTASSTTFDLRDKSPSPEISESWMPPPPDPFLTIPGELILAVERKRRTEYWPARIEEYVPPTKPSAKQKYRVRFLDDKTIDVERECFFTSTEKGFATCKIGVFESAVDQDENDAENESEDDRSESPEPKMPPPKRERFCDLSMREQFAYAKPVVHAILNDSFGPARERHAEFVQGGASRQKLKKQGTGKGDLSSQEVTQLGNLINRWVLRDERHATKVTEEELAVFSAEDAPVIPGEASETHRQAAADAPATESFIRPSSPAPSVLTELADVEPPPPSQMTVSTLGSERADNVEDDFAARLPRQHGCEAFEALSAIERIEYCSLVLLHEVVLQILLWRNEKRKALELLEPEEEERLHRVALELSEERDWVPMVMNMRRTQVKILEAKKAKASSLDALWKGDEPPKAPESVGGTRSRPRRQSSARH